MKKQLLSALVVAITIAGATELYIQYFDSEQAASLIEKSQVKSAEGKVIEAILYSNGCQYCHTPDATMPFYSHLPIASTLMEDDIKYGTGSFLLNNVIANLDTPVKITTSDLNKLEFATIHDTMPTTLFKMVHWGNSLSAQQKTEMLAWIKKVRILKQEPVVEGAFVSPVPDALMVEEDKVALGNFLYHDVRLSGDNTISCATCHQLDKGGDDNMTTSTGISGQKGGISAPTVYNAALNFTQFWDGRAHDLATQAGGPPMNPIEMGSAHWEEIIAKLEKDTEFKEKFLAVYGQLNGDNITNAIAEFEKTLLTPDSRYDLHLKGDKTQLTPLELEGYEMFREYRCDTCHGGVNMGGNSFEKFSIYGDYYQDRLNNKGIEKTDADKGRFAQTNDPVDMSRFKTPTLRNIALTGPYMHDGQSETLEEAVATMLKYQVNVEPTENRVVPIVAFLKTLIGKHNGKLLTE